MDDIILALAKQIKDLSSSVDNLNTTLNTTFRSFINHPEKSYRICSYCNGRRWLLIGNCPYTVCSTCQGTGQIEENSK